MNQIKNACAAIISSLPVLSLCGCSGKRTYPPVTDINNLGGRRIGENMAWSADYMLSGRDDVNDVR